MSRRRLLSLVLVVMSKCSQVMRQGPHIAVGTVVFASGTLGLTVGDHRMPVAAIPASMSAA
jgi:hypothetical protein